MATLWVLSLIILILLLLTLLILYVHIWVLIYCLPQAASALEATPQKSEGQLRLGTVIGCDLRTPSPQTPGEAD